VSKYVKSIKELYNVALSPLEDGILSTVMNESIAICGVACSWVAYSHLGKFLSSIDRNAIETQGQFLKELDRKSASVYM
jgi:hypothetical protein